MLFSSFYLWFGVNGQLDVQNLVPCLFFFTLCTSPASWGVPRRLLSRGWVVPASRASQGPTASPACLALPSRMVARHVPALFASNIVTAPPCAFSLAHRASSSSPVQLMRVNGATSCGTSFRPCLHIGGGRCTVGVPRTLEGRCKDVGTFIL